MELKDTRRLLGVALIILFGLYILTLIDEQSFALISAVVVLILFLVFRLNAVMNGKAAFAWETKIANVSSPLFALLISLYVVAYSQDPNHTHEGKRLLGRTARFIHDSFGNSGETVLGTLGAAISIVWLIGAWRKENST